MLMSCPHHRQSNDVLVHSFIEGLEPNTKSFLDLTTCVQTLGKIYVELYTFLNRISQGNLEWNGGNLKHMVQKTTGVLEI